MCLIPHAQIRSGQLPLAHPVRCLLCRDTMEARDIALHAHRMHPGTDAWPQRWPDGEAVVHEDPELIEEA